MQQTPMDWQFNSVVTLYILAAAITGSLAARPACRGDLLDMETAARNEARALVNNNWMEVRDADGTRSGGG